MVPRALLPDARPRGGPEDGAHPRPAAGRRRRPRSRLASRRRGLPRLVLLLAAALALALPAQAGDAVLDVWYGEPQPFGHLGQPQQWVNVLGNVSDPEGVDALRFRLNGGPARALSIGPDRRRLHRPGDFNVELDFAELVDGTNEITLEAVDGLGDVTTRTVTVDYAAGNVWPRTFTADWSAASRIADAAQVVDGKWSLGPEGIRPVEVGYDRTVAIGDVQWDDFVATVPITIHAIDESAYDDSLSGAPGIGLQARWLGHTTLKEGEQPHQNWLPKGATAWYDYEFQRFSLSGEDGLLVRDSSVAPAFGETHYWKVRAESLPSGETFYAFKFWPAGEPEPSEWLLSGNDGVDDLDNGSLLLIAHYVDATFGDVEVRGLGDDTTPPEVQNVSVVSQEESVEIRWETNEPATSYVDYGLTSSYELGRVGSGDLSTTHAVTLGALEPGSTYHFRVASADGDGNETLTADDTFVAPGTPPPPDSSLVSDDFSASSLDASLWTFVDPTGDSGLDASGYTVLLSPDPGSSHDIWTGGIGVPRIMQPAQDEDFELEVKFDSDLSEDFESQGVLVDAGGGNHLRIEFHSSSGSVKLYVARFTSDEPSVVASQALASGAGPFYLRVRRIGDEWTVRRSSDGSTWTTATTFTHAMTPAEVGVYAGNSAGTSHTAVVDYFFNTASPIEPEDGGVDPDRSLAVEVTGEGSVLRNPDRSLYALGEVVELTAEPATGWVFDRWGGDLSGDQNPVTLSIDSDPSVTADFVPDPSDTTPPELSNVVVEPSSDSATIEWTTDEPATGTVEWGSTSSYTGSLSDGAFLTQHGFTLTGLEPESTYHYRVSSTDAAGNTASTADATFVTTEIPLEPGPVSDDFSAAMLDTELWTRVDPHEDAQFRVDGRRVQIEVPGSASHDAWSGSNTLARLMQPAADGDLQLEVKFDSPLDTGYQSQGVLVAQDATNYIRCELHHSDGAVRAFTATVTDDDPELRANLDVSTRIPPGTAPMYLRLTRSDDLWVVEYSSDGSDWREASRFLHSMSVASVGPYAGNAVGTPHRASVDYFFDTTSPIEPEDGTTSALVVNVEGGGFVVRSPERDHYSVGDSVDLELLREPGWLHRHWRVQEEGSEPVAYGGTRISLELDAFTLATAVLRPTACNDGLDNDGDGLIDWDGGGAGDPDPQCDSADGRRESRLSSGGSCGLGFEIVLVLAPLLLLRRRRGLGVGPA